MLNMYLKFQDTKYGKSRQKKTEGFKGQKNNAYKLPEAVGDPEQVKEC